MKLIEYEVPKCEEDWKFQTLSEKRKAYVLGVQSRLAHENAICD